MCYSGHKRNDYCAKEKVFKLVDAGYDDAAYFSAVLGGRRNERNESKGMTDRMLIVQLGYDLLSSYLVALLLQYLQLSTSMNCKSIDRIIPALGMVPCILLCR